MSFIAGKPRTLQIYLHKARLPTAPGMFLHAVLYRQSSPPCGSQALAGVLRRKSHAVAGRQSSRERLYPSAQHVCMWLEQTTPSVNTTPKVETHQIWHAVAQAIARLWRVAHFMLSDFLQLPIDEQSLGHQPVRPSISPAASLVRPSPLGRGGGGPYPARSSGSIERMIVQAGCMPATFGGALLALTGTSCWLDMAARHGPQQAQSQSAVTGWLALTAPGC